MIPRSVTRCNEASAAAVALLSVMLAVSSVAAAQPQSETLLDSVRFEQRLGAQLPLGLSFHDEHGADVKLGDFFGRRPVLLALAYYRCPMLCGLVLSGLLRAVVEMSFTAGREFDIVIVSIDPRDTPALAAKKKDNYVHHYHRPGAAAGWHFLTSSEPGPVKALADAIGFRYAYDERSGQFAHPSGVVAVTPTGQVSRYFYGVEYLPTHLRYGLIEAASGKIGSPVDQLLLRCYHYDAKTGRYGILIWRVVQLACVGMMIVMAILLGPLLRQLLREGRREREKR